MNRISVLHTPSALPILVAFVALILLAIAGCSEVSPAIGKYYTGRTLHLSVVAMDREPEVIYSLHRSGVAPKYFRIAPLQGDRELLLLRVKVENHKATSAIVSIDQNAAEIRDFFHEKYFPLDVMARPEEIEAPEDISGQRIARCPLQAPTDLCFLWNASVFDESIGENKPRAFELLQGFGVDGWLIFEIPKEAEIRELRWRAGDGLTIEF